MLTRLVIICLSFRVFAQSEIYWLNIDSAAHHLKLSPDENYLAYSNKSGDEIRILDLKTKKIYLERMENSGHSFIWSNLGKHLLIRKMLPAKDGIIESSIWSFDALDKSSTKIATFYHQIGYLNLNPKDLKLRFIYPRGVHVINVSYQDYKRAKWQTNSEQAQKFWLASPHAIFLVHSNPSRYQAIFKSNSKITSFDLSPDGNEIAWSTEENKIYRSLNGAAIFVDYGQDPKWHPNKKNLLFAGARMVGNSVRDFDLKIITQEGRHIWLTNSQHSRERWPNWSISNRGILFTKEKTVDIFFLEWASEEWTQK